MPSLHRVLFTASLITIGLPSPILFAQQFDGFGDAPLALTAPKPTPDLVFEIGGGINMKPAYEGASDYTASLMPIIRIDQLHIGFIDIDSTRSRREGLTFAPSFSFIGERVSADHEALWGLDNVDPTLALGGSIGYRIPLGDALTAEIYGRLRYGFGGAEGLQGDLGAKLTAQLTPELELVGGPVVNFVSDNYMETYFGVSEAASSATGGRLAAYSPQGGIKSVGLELSARYEFMPDTILSLNASYSQLVGAAADSPIVQAGEEGSFVVGIGLSRRFSVSY